MSFIDSCFSTLVCISYWPFKDMKLIYLFKHRNRLVDDVVVLIFDGF